MHPNTRALVAAAATSLTNGRSNVGSIYDYSQSRYIQISGTAQGGNVALYDCDRGCHFSGSDGSLFDYGRSCHVSLQMNGYLMLDLEDRLDTAWRSRAIRYNHMLKDFKQAPASYERVVFRFMNWRDRL